LFSVCLAPALREHTSTVSLLLIYLTFAYVKYFLFFLFAPTLEYRAAFSVS
jgi:hypothetical protein